MRYTVILVALISTFVIAPLTYMIADNQPPYEYDADKSYIIPEKTAAGHQITVHWKFSRINRICVGTIMRYIVDQRTNARISYDPTAAAATVEVGVDYLERTFFLPQGIVTGKKWYYAEGSYACNPLQRFYPLVVRTPRLSFEVIE